MNKMLVLLISEHGIRAIDSKMNIVDLYYDYLYAKELLIPCNNVAGFILIETITERLKEFSDEKVKIFIANDLDEKVNSIVEISDKLRKNKLYGREGDIDYYWELKRRYSAEVFAEIESELDDLTDELNRLIA